jgi:hypothetical protein
MKQQYLIIMLSALTLFSCSSGKNRLEKGHYDVAVYKAVNRLKQKPDHKKASRVLKEAYTLAVNEHMGRIAYQDKSNNLFKYDRMVGEYRQISNLNNAIRKYPKYAKLIQLIDVSDELIFSKSQAAKIHVQEGDKLLNIGSKQRARDAYFHFIDANSFVPGSVSVQELDRAQEAGTVNVAVEFENNNNMFSGFQSADLYNGLFNGIKSTRYRFLRIIEPGSDIEMDELVQVEMSDAFIGGVDFSRNKIEVSRDDVYLGEAETDSGEVVEVYGTVNADYIEFCKTINSRASIMIQRIDPTSAVVLRREVIPSSFNWTEKWATYKGDKRALSKSQLNFANRSEPSIPNPVWLFAQATEPLIGNGIQYFRNQYNHLR